MDFAALFSRFSKIPIKVFHSSRTPSTVAFTILAWEVPELGNATSPVHVPAPYGRPLTQAAPEIATESQFISHVFLRMYHKYLMLTNLGWEIRILAIA